MGNPELVSGGSSLQEERGGAPEELADRRPLALRAVGALHIALGLFAIAQLLAGLTVHRVALRLDLLGLPIGLGLLRLSRGWRSLALIFVAVRTGILAWTSLALVHSTEIRRWSLLPWDRPVPVDRRVALAFEAVFLALLLWEYRVLTSRHVMKAFGLLQLPGHRKIRGALTVPALLLGAAILGAAVTVSPSIPHWVFFRYEGSEPGRGDWSGQTQWPESGSDHLDFKDRQSSHLRVQASSPDEGVFAELNFEIEMGVRGDGHATFFKIIDHSSPPAGPYALSSNLELGPLAGDVEIGLVSSPETARHSVAWKDSGGGSKVTWSYGNALCPILSFRLNWIHSKDPRWARLAYPEIDSPKAHLVTNDWAPAGMIPGGHRPVAWRVELIPRHADRPVQRFSIAQGEEAPNP